MAETKTTKPTSVADYIEGLPEPVQAALASIRETIRTAAPDTVESLSYGILKFSFSGTFLHIGAWKAHFGLYPIYPDAGSLEADVAPYRAAKDTLRFRYDRPLPLDLIARLVHARVEQQARRAE